MERYDCEKGEMIEKPEVDLFLEEIVEVFKKHGFSLSHEDTQGAFVVEPLNDFNIRWIMDAHCSDEVSQTY